MNNRHQANVQWLIDGVLTTSGDTDSAIRRVVEQYAAESGGLSTEKVIDIPAGLATYIKKVALYAYKTTDEDIETLLQAGFSEDAIYEITLSTALGAGIGRLERGLKALREARDET